MNRLGRGEEAVCYIILLNHQPTTAADPGPTSTFILSTVKKLPARNFWSIYDAEVTEMLIDFTCGCWVCA